MGRAHPQGAVTRLCVKNNFNGQDARCPSGRWGLVPPPTPHLARNVENPKGQAPERTSFLPRLRLGLRHIRRASAPALHPRLFRPARNMTIETDASHSTVPSYMPRECSNLDQASAQNIVRGLLRAVSAWSWRNAALFETSSSKDTGSNPFTSTPALSIRERRMIRGQ